MKQWHFGHDLGHVPFGHSGERVLDDICKENGIGCFCHNAQSVRWLLELEKNGLGLNISIQTLDGILCHNGEMLLREYRPNYLKTSEEFLKEYKECFNSLEESKIIKPMTLEGCVVRLSDIIAYVGRDIEDAIILNVIKRDDIPSNVKKYLGVNNSDIINNLILDVIENSIDKSYLSYSEKTFNVLQELLDFNYKNIYLSPYRKEQDKEIVPIFNELFIKYVNQIENNDIKDEVFYEFVHMNNNEYLNNTNIKRIAIDYISGQTDDFFLKECEKINK